MKTFSDPRFLVIYSAAVTIAFAATLLCGSFFFLNGYISD